MGPLCLVPRRSQFLIVADLWMRHMLIVVCFCFLFYFTRGGARRASQPSRSPRQRRRPQRTSAASRLLEIGGVSSRLSDDRGSSGGGSKALVVWMCLAKRTASISDEYSLTLSPHVRRQAKTVVVSSQPAKCLSHMPSTEIQVLHL